MVAAKSGNIFPGNPMHNLKRTNKNIIYDVILNHCMQLYHQQNGKLRNQN